MIPKENEKDLADIPANVKRGLQLVRVEHMDEVLAAALALVDAAEFLQTGDHEFDGHPRGAPAAADAGRAAVAGGDQLSPGA